MIISEKQIMQLMEFVEAAIDGAVGVNYRMKASILLSEIIRQQSEELKVIE